MVLFSATEVDPWRAIILHKRSVSKNEVCACAVHVKKATWAGTWRVGPWIYQHRVPPWEATGIPVFRYCFSVCMVACFSLCLAHPRPPKVSNNGAFQCD
eukprot:4870020-Karenia_brevis.AAC.1